MKEKMTVGEFAKLKNISQETLRHYDRMGLLKPQWTDEMTGYRYYSIFQYETLSTISELRDLGMPLKEIKEFLEKRDVDRTLLLLEERHQQLSLEIQRLSVIEKRIAHKLAHLKKYSAVKPSQEYEVKAFPERQILLWKQELKNGIPEEYGFAELEGQLKQFAPIFAENRYGIRVSLGDTIREYMFLFLDGYEKMEEQQSETIVNIIKEGKYACIFWKYETQELETFLDEFICRLMEDGRKPDEDVVMIAQVDLSVVGDVDQILYEIQVPIKQY
ncbi:MAG: MerR family transcriptional regulator [Hungatella sp.]|nr:MerR family transcriptional regulator [Hungatella sp.]